MISKKLIVFATVASTLVLASSALAVEQGGGTQSTEGLGMFMLLLGLVAVAVVATVMMGRAGDRES